MLRNIYRTSSFLATVLMLAGPSFAGDKHKDMTIDIEGEDGENISITVSSGLVEGIIEGLSENAMECDVTSDKETLAMLQHLDRKGEGSKYTFINEEGEEIKAQRRKGQLEMEIVKSGENNTIISMPWSMGECMMGRDVPISQGNDKLEFKVEKDGGVRIRIE